MENTKDHWGLLFILFFFTSCFFSFLLLREVRIIKKEEYSFIEEKKDIEITTLQYNYHKYKDTKMKMSQYKDRVNNLDSTNNNDMLGNPKKSFIFHKVESGETLWKIAIFYNVSVEDLILMNNIRNPDLIFSGSVLKIRRKS